MEHASNYQRETKRAQSVTGWIWEHLSFDRLCPKSFQNIASMGIS